MVIADNSPPWCGPIAASSNSHGATRPGPQVVIREAYVLSWVENLDGHGTLSDDIVLFTTKESMSGVACADLTNNGAPDIVFFMFSDQKVMWLRNTGAGVFSAAEIIASTDSNIASSPFMLAAVDMTGSGRLDIVYRNAELDAVGFITHERKSGSI